MLKNFISKFSQSEKIIFFIVLLFIVGASYLFSIDSRYNNPQYNQDWFALSFSQPQTNNFDFTIENFTSQSDFHWEILTEEKKISEGFAIIAPRNKKEIKIEADIQEKGKITVRVSSPKETGEIYKNIK